MTCTLCLQRYALSAPVIDEWGNKRSMCIQCAAEHGRPSKFPEGTQNSPRMPKTDFADDERSAVGREAELRAAQVQALAKMLRMLLETFPELRTSLTTAPQQALLREARALLAEVGL